MIKDALVQGAFRYWLRRDWGGPRSIVLWAMLNPSVADAEITDATLTRCVNYSRGWGYTSLYLVNLYAYISTDPTELRANLCAVGPDNDWHISNLLPRATEVIVAWGGNKMVTAGGRHLEVLRLIREHHSPRCLGLTKHNHPLHPLRQRADLVPVSYEEFQ